MNTERELLFIGGRLGGQQVPLQLPSQLPLPSQICTRAAGGRWEHYTRRNDDGTYQYAGLCVYHEHYGPPPDEQRCWCGWDNCDGTGEPL